MANLADICELDTADRDNSRVVSFYLAGDRLEVGEECDNYFGVKLTAEQVGLLIAHLQDALTKIEASDG